MGCRCKCGAACTKHCWNKSDWTLRCEYCGAYTANNPCQTCIDSMKDIQKSNYDDFLRNLGVDPDKDIPF